MSKQIHVAVGVIQDSNDRILIAKRPHHLHQGGKWEFPGGKVEKQETTSEALIRELKEEVNLDVASTTPLMEIHHDYGDKKVFLDVHRVTNFSGIAIGVEGQRVEWVKISQLSQYEFPEANKVILEKILS
ncbi:8-oxo-dGTP diphosphatase MutT [Shewanella schlegeliana]|uniref:8-oxo-dGTP diphosphatase n=1 Tax=Shewanella schlegeliana TaxID=190308 RepID=A0ABS1T1X2_9GAMM|nr:8-oxo-dGTP diphosphatase MutT [Shewanella schlegeliana]MBL4914793.1 8-oxo-dGTP diphosphatase MutT [Shewanella schlegeliana]MCL1110516.1 8-oxo-dGTP diphosphatase MutT [Shewanella schlegeliana]GIU27321.1 7,8-dihydro-8-oxoguanine-triphosphatase [Shewanella schlegeliana]